MADDQPEGASPDAGSLEQASAAPEAPKSVRAPRRPRNPFIVFFSALFSLAFLGVLAVCAALYWGKLQFGVPGPLAEDKTVLIRKGQGSEIADILERENVIDQAWLFRAGVYTTKAQSRLKAGEYLFPKHVTMARALDILIEGKSIQYQVTIPEGLTSEQIAGRLREDPVLVGDLREIPAEGSLLPETYRFTRGTTRQEIVEKMRQAQRRLVEDVWKRRAADLPVRSAADLVTLASIVEKETGKAEERPRVASVFANRLRKSMRLQSDPTIIYGIAGGKGMLDRPILRSDIDRATPYNTYTIDGLPPTPIANPGRDAIEAAANPLRTDDVFFVADGTGGHVFAATLEDHNRNVAQWREVERQRGGGATSALAPAAPPAPALVPTAPAPVRTPAGPRTAPATASTPPAPGTTPARAPAASASPASGTAPARAPAAARPAGAPVTATPTAAPAGAPAAARTPPPTASGAAPAAGAAPRAASRPPATAAAGGSPGAGAPGARARTSE